MEIYKGKDSSVCLQLGTLEHYVMAKHPLDAQPKKYCNENNWKRYLSCARSLKLLKQLKVTSFNENLIFPVYSIPFI